MVSTIVVRIDSTNAVIESRMHKSVVEQRVVKSQTSRFRRPLHISSQSGRVRGRASTIEHVGDSITSKCIN